MIGSMRTSIGSYLDHKLLGFFRDRLWPVIADYTPDTEDGSRKFRHIFFAPVSEGTRGAFRAFGVQSPWVALWADGPLKYWDFLYGQSVKDRDLVWFEPNPDDPPSEEEKAALYQALDEPVYGSGWVTSNMAAPAAGGDVPIHRGHFVDRHAVGRIEHFERSYALACSSFFRSFTERVNQDVLEADRLRYFKMAFPEIHPYWHNGRMELLLENIATQDQVGPDGQRSFTLVCRYTFRCTLPMIPVMQPEAMERIRVFLDNNKIYEARVGQ